MRPVRPGLRHARTASRRRGEVYHHHLTLWGGCASTVCWPPSACLVEQVGWRGACLAYAGLHLAVTLAPVLGLIPGVPASAEVDGGSDVRMRPACAGPSS